MNFSEKCKVASYIIVLVWGLVLAYGFAYTGYVFLHAKLTVGP